MSNYTRYWHVACFDMINYLEHFNQHRRDPMETCALYYHVNPSTAKLFNLNIHPLEIVSR